MHEINSNKYNFQAISWNCKEIWVISISNLFQNGLFFSSVSNVSNDFWYSGLTLKEFIQIL